MKDTMLLISTSGRAASAAIGQNGASVRLRVSDNGLTHSETIMSLIDSLFDEGLSLGNISSVCADVGPGSFTGVRIGVCIANAMAYALNKPVIEVSSLEALALAVDTDRPVCALIDARNGNGYAALYQSGRELIAPSAVVIAELLPSLPKNTVFTGDGAAIHRESILSVVPNAEFASPDKYTLTADMLARPAQAHFERGDIKQEARPLYLRPTQAERMFKAKEQLK